MVDSDPVYRLLESDEFASSRKLGPDRWSQGVTKALETDIKIRHVPDGESVYSLLPEESPADPALVFPLIKRLRLFGMPTITSLAETPQAEIDLMFNTRKGRNSRVHRLALALREKAIGAKNQTSLNSNRSV